MQEVRKLLMSVINMKKTKFDLRIADFLYLFQLSSFQYLTYFARSRQIDVKRQHLLL